jgi:hypothetical protein
VTLEQLLKDLEAAMAERLRSMIAASEAGMIQAARAAIAEKARIDQRLVVRVKRSAEAEVRRMAEAGQTAAEAKRIEAEAKRAEAERQPAEAEAKRRAAEIERHAREEKARQEKAQAALSKPAARPKPEAKPVMKPTILSSVQGTSQAAPRPAPQPAPAPAPKIVVVETPVAARPTAEPEVDAAQVSGRGGWKSVRRDPARVLAQAKAKAKPANRADAIDLAQAAQAAIERFIAERGVTKTETSGIQTLVSRLQARGYIVVRDEKGWTIDQRHRIDSESDLVAFAQARGIALSAAA